jgi:hypothetical protein
LLGRLTCSRRCGCDIENSGFTYAQLDSTVSSMAVRISVNSRRLSGRHYRKPISYAWNRTPRLPPSFGNSGFASSKPLFGKSPVVCN